MDSLPSLEFTSGQAMPYELRIAAQRMLVDGRASPSYVEENLRIVLEMLGDELKEQLKIPPRGQTWLDPSSCRRLRTENAVMADCMSALVLYLAVRIALLSHDGSSINSVNIQTSNVQVEVKLDPNGDLMDSADPGGTLALRDLMVKGISHLTAKDSQTGADLIKGIFDTQLVALLNKWHDTHRKMYQVSSLIVPKLEPEHSFLAKAAGGANISDNANAAAKQSNILGEFIYMAAIAHRKLDTALSSEEEEERRQALVPITLTCAGHTACCSLDWGWRSMRKLLEELLGDDLALFAAMERASTDLLSLARSTQKLLNFKEENMYEKGYQLLFKHSLEKEYPECAILMEARLTKGGRQYVLLDGALEMFYNRKRIVWFVSLKRKTIAGADNKLNHNVLFHLESSTVQSGYQALTVLKDKVYDGLRFASNSTKLAKEEKWSPLTMQGVSATICHRHPPSATHHRHRRHPPLPPLTSSATTDTRCGRPTWPPWSSGPLPLAPSSSIRPTMTPTPM